MASATPSSGFFNVDDAGINSPKEAMGCMGRGGQVKAPVARAFAASMLGELSLWRIAAQGRCACGPPCSTSGRPRTRPSTTEPWFGPRGWRPRLVVGPDLAQPLDGIARTLALLGAVHAAAASPYSIPPKWRQCRQGRAGAAPGEKCMPVIRPGG